MKSIFRFAKIVLAHPITNIFLGLMFLYSGISEALEDYKNNDTGIKVHHGVALYGFTLFIKSVIAWLKALKSFHKEEH